MDFVEQMINKVYQVFVLRTTIDRMIHLTKRRECSHLWKDIFENGIVDVEVHHVVEPFAYFHQPKQFHILSLKNQSFFLSHIRNWNQKIQIIGHNCTC